MPALVAIGMTALLFLTACGATPDAGSSRVNASLSLVDMEISAGVRSVLGNDREIDAAGIQVGTRDGTVRLSGHVHSEMEQRRAVALASSVAGVRWIDANLEVLPP